ncbi:SWIM zinc finger family protein [Paenibacillus sp. KQZ6P-2]|uniref:SWIM zinc finger family protein n=1 Tax=Paenibacillus mangrovi TaxID=2931978 RepID=A0A9X1WSH5_9BACL|nr:SWIM zinc finger family protein [Paenibacillus mangrovi]MCJ8014542.1 SWIM zinc finger family protein [Paenibacillus mangrovi]
MNPNDTIDDIEWQQLIQSVGEQFNDLTIKRGFQYFKRGFVHPARTTDTGHIEAIVEGSELYRVELDLNVLSASRCSCPVPSHCKHMIAVLLDYVSKQGRSVHAIVNAHSTAMFKQSVKTPYNDAPAISERRGEAISLLQEKASQIPEMSIAEWHGLFKLCITPLEFSSSNGQYARNAIAAIDAVRPPLSPVMGQLFDLHAHLFMLMKLVKPAQQRSSHTYMGYHTQVAADELQEAMTRIFEEGLEINSEPELWPRVIKTLTYLRRQMLTEPKSFSYLFEAYDQLWLKWIHPNLEDTEMYSEELQKLGSAEEELGDTLSKLPWMLAQSRIYFLIGEDRQAWTWLQTADKASIIPPDYLISFLKMLAGAEVWPRLQTWLVQIGPMLSSHRKGHLNDYMDYWHTAVQHFPESENEMWKTLASMLPYSKDIYEETLLRYGKWQQWMDIQLSTGKEPLEFRVSVLQPIEKNAPELLLPFYHQAVERYILLKNRSSYKAAVKLLKRLSKLYAKMKQQERWEHFITAFTSRNSRLRALQEELRKGKLIS